MQVTIARQLGLEPTTVGNFFMNARRRSMDKWKDEDPVKPSSSQAEANSLVTQDVLWHASYPLQHLVFLWIDTLGGEPVRYVNIRIYFQIVSGIEFWYQNIFWYLRYVSHAC